jgi:repressor LexA
MEPELTPRQKQILDFITGFREKQGYFPSLREIGAHFRLSLGTVQTHLEYLKRKGALSWEKGKTRALKLAGSASQAAQAAVQNLQDWLEVPVLGRVSAGPGLLAEENREDTLRLPQGFLRFQSKDLFGLKVKGDSMMGAGILDGDLVVVKVQPSAQDRDLVVAMVEDEALVKTFRREGGRMFLYSANPAYPPREVGEGFKILGKVVHLMRWM